MLLIYRIFTVTMLLSVWGCSSFTIQTEKDFYKWLNDPDNGFVKSKKVNNLEFRVKYLPKEYLAWKDYQELPIKTGHAKDSLIKYYNNSHTFLLTIGPDTSKGANADIMYSGVSSYEEYAAKVMELNFNLETYVSLKTDKSEFVPVLSNMENVYGLVKHRNFIVVFSDEGSGEIAKSPELDFVLKDDIFSTGTNHFVFSKKNMGLIPKLSFW